MKIMCRSLMRSCCQSGRLALKAPLTSRRQAAARKLRKADAALQSFQRPDYFLDVRYDSIYLLQFELANGLLIMH